MDTYTIAEAAQLVGTSRGTLYQALRAGHLQGAPRAQPGQGLRVTREALRTAGFSVPGPVAPGAIHGLLAQANTLGISPTATLIRTCFLTQRFTDT